MPHNVKGPLLGLVCCATGLALLVFAAYSIGPVAHLDLHIYLHFEPEGSRGLGPAGLLVHLGDLGPLLALTTFVAGLGLYFGRRRQVVVALAVVIGANATTQLLKVLLEHPRHAFEGGGSHPFWRNYLPNDNAFPSGHTTAAAAIAVALLFVVPTAYRMSAATAGLLLTAAVAISVVIVGWHYPSDALGAMLVAAAWGFLMVAALRLSSRREHADGRNTSEIHGPLAVSGD